jgi:hypothetical protein
MTAVSSPQETIELNPNPNPSPSPPIKNEQPKDTKEKNTTSTTTAATTSNKPGQSWKTNEQHILPKNNLPLVFTGMMLAIFLAAIDQTIVATALPTISGHLGGGSKYSWVGSSYLLASASLAPLYGKLADICGRKPVIFTAIFIFLLGSALCGAAKSIDWLIICRVVQGIGGGGIQQVSSFSCLFVELTCFLLVQLIQITISDIVSLEE